MTNIFDKANFLAKTYRYSGSYGAGWGVGAMLFWSFSSLAFYVYSAITLMFIAKKTSTANGWMAWVPFLNLYLMCKTAGKSGMWIILLLLPFINIVAIVLLWAAIAERLGKPAWWGILMLVPIANFVIMGILAFSGGTAHVRAPKRAAPVVSLPSVESGGIVCPKCGAQAEESDKFCPDCGAKLAKKSAKKSEGNFCPGCRAKIEEGAKFCPDCGAKI